MTTYTTQHIRRLVLQAIRQQYPDYPRAEVYAAVRHTLAALGTLLPQGRVELRSVGVFTLKRNKPKVVSMWGGHLKNGRQNGTTHVAERRWTTGKVVIKFKPTRNITRQLSKSEI